MSRTRDGLNGAGVAKTDAGPGAAGACRTMQFVIERDCPHRSLFSGATRPVPMEFPRMVWVEIPGVFFGLDCGGLSYRVITAEIDRIAREFPKRADETCGNAVCEHMGSLVE